VILSPEQSQKALSHVTKFWGDRPCQICAEPHQYIVDRIVQVTDFNPNILRPQAVYPLVMVYCPRCGNTTLINAIAVGVVSPPQGSTQPPPAAETPDG
jgi:hypothetical protein